MPLYEYKCGSCGVVTEVRHGFDESVSEPCARCGGQLTRLFNPAGIVFKGSGFYVTDSRKAAGAGKASGESKSGGESKPGGETKPSAGEKPAGGASTESPAA